MKQFSIGNTGVTVSALGLGCNNFGLRIDTDASRAVIHKSLDLGTSFRHSADVYGTRGGSENSFGQKKIGADFRKNNSILGATILAADQADQQKTGKLMPAGYTPTSPKRASTMACR